MSIKLKAALAGVALSGMLIACTPAENTETAPAAPTMTMQRQEITELEQWVTRHRAGSAAPAPGTAQPTG